MVGLHLAGGIKNVVVSDIVDIDADRLSVWVLPSHHSAEFVPLVVGPAAPKLVGLDIRGMKQNLFRSGIGAQFEVRVRLGAGHEPGEVGAKSRIGGPGKGMATYTRRSRLVERFHSSIVQLSALGLAYNVIIVIR